MAIDAQTAAGIGQQATSLIPEDEKETDAAKRGGTGALKGAGKGLAMAAPVAAATGPFAPLFLALGAGIGAVVGGVSGAARARKAQKVTKKEAAPLVQKEADVVSAYRAKAQEQLLPQLPGIDKMRQDDEEDDETRMG